MESIFSESNSGISEINIGTEDILSKILKIHELSTRSKNKMESLHGMLNEFNTRQDIGQQDVDLQVDNGTLSTRTEFAAVSAASAPSNSATESVNFDDPNTLSEI